MVDLAPVAQVGESNEGILEIRYRPNARVLDHRGAWAEIISAHMELPQWQIVQNRIDVHTKDQSQHVFIGFRNCGLACADFATAGFFLERMQKFIRKTFQLEGFDNPLFVERLGVRLRFAVPYAGAFATLLSAFSERYVQVEPATKAVFGDARLVDAGAPLNFEDAVGHFNTVAGPMARAQFQQFFRKDEGFPEVGLYVDVDYWSRPERSLDAGDVLAMAKAFATAADRRAEQVRRVVLGGGE